MVFFYFSVSFPLLRMRLFKIVLRLRCLVKTVAEHRRSKVLHIVAACHHLSVCSGAAYGHEVAAHAQRQKSSGSPHVAGLSDRTHDVVGLVGREEGPHLC